MVLRADAVRGTAPQARGDHLHAGSDPTATSADPRDAWARERGLQLGAEIVLDVGNHILSAHFGVSAQDYGTSSCSSAPGVC